MTFVTHFELKFGVSMSFLYKIYSNLDCLLVSILLQKPTILLLTVISRGSLPTSSRTMYNDVLLRKCVRESKNWFSMASNILQSSNPKTSRPYVNIGRILLSNYFSWRSMGRSRFLIRIFKRNMAFLACSVTCFLACRKETRFGENSS